MLKFFPRHCQQLLCPHPSKKLQCAGHIRLVEATQPACIWRMRKSAMAHKAAGGVGAKRAAATGNFPRTRLPFLRNLVQSAQCSPNTYCTVAPFKSYPPYIIGEQRKPASRVLYKDPQCIVVNDAFPKSRMHCLVMPLDPSLGSLNDLRTDHVPLLQHLMDVAEKYVLFTRSDGVSREAGLQLLEFMVGFHSLPSLPQLHMHLISRDFDGPCIKTKKHYNSFATAFFLPAEKVVEDLERNGRVTLNQNTAELTRLEHEEPQCLWCGLKPGGFQQLRVHLRTCPSSRACVPSTLSTA
uniref:HIT domain-containing protein n=1 Tax=Trypanosoma congolense (strain IL3000) TaxID=1068625 RepID=G0UKA3_TRYCI|nr:conserved hypothetical protein [Trypanosoma congolense IL3000]